MNLNELKPFGELDKYIDNPSLDEYSQRAITSLWEPQAGLIVQPRREPWGKPTKYMEEPNPPEAGQDGRDGTDGTDGRDGKDGDTGPQGPQGPAGTDASLPAGIIVFSTLESLGDGWQLCDGTNGTPDLRGRFVVTVGTSPGANPTTYGVEDVGGYDWHGQSENNHNDHRLSHIHDFPTLTPFTCVDTVSGSTTMYAFTSDFVPCCGNTVGDVAQWCGSDNLPSQEAPYTCVPYDYARHKGPFNSCMDTDNRPPYIALYAHIKL